MSFAIDQTYHTLKLLTQSKKMRHCLWYSAEIVVCVSVVMKKKYHETKTLAVFVNIYK